MKDTSATQPKRYPTYITLGLCAAAIVTTVPFAVWHALRNSWISALLIGGVDVCAFIIGFQVLRRGGLSAQALIALTAVGNALTLAMVHRVGELGIYWSFPLALLNYFLLPARAGSFLNAGVLLISLASASTWAGVAEWLRLLPTLSATVAFAAVFALNVERQTRQLQTLVDHDPLTGARNRRALEQQLRIAISLYQRHRTPSSLIFIDIDHFKKINDDYGHDRGDRVLIELVAVLQNRLRNADQLFRFGGEEFVILLPQLEARGALTLAQALRQRVEETPLAGLEQVTISVGVAEITVGDNQNTWLKRGDEALYQAKTLGRNRVEVAKPPVKWLVQACG